MNELAIIAALQASRVEKLKAIDESEAKLIEAVKASHDAMRAGVGNQIEGDPDAVPGVVTQSAVKTDAADEEFPPVKAGTVSVTEAPAAEIADNSESVSAQ